MGLFSGQIRATLCPHLDSIFKSSCTRVIVSDFLRHKPVLMLPLPASADAGHVTSSWFTFLSGSGCPARCTACMHARCFVCCLAPVTPMSQPLSSRGCGWLPDPGQAGLAFPRAKCTCMYGPERGVAMIINTVNPLTKIEWKIN